MFFKCICLCEEQQILNTHNIIKRTVDTPYSYVATDYHISHLQLNLTNCDTCVILHFGATWYTAQHIN